MLTSIGGVIGVILGIVLSRVVSRSPGAYGHQYTGNHRIRTVFYSDRSDLWAPAFGKGCEPESY